MGLTITVQQIETIIESKFIPLYTTSATASLNVNEMTVAILKLSNMTYFYKMIEGIYYIYGVKKKAQSSISIPSHDIRST